MNFELTEDQLMVRDMVRRFAEERILPHAEDWDASSALPGELFEKLGELGLMGMVVPAASGGSELDYVTVSLVIEEIARCDGSAALILSNHNLLVTGHILRAGSEEQQRTFLPGLASGRVLGAYAFSGFPAGSEQDSIDVTAARDGDHWILRGTTAQVTYGAQAGLIVVLARTTSDDTSSGVTAFVVEGDDEGFSADSDADRLGMRATGSATLRFEGLRVSDDRRLGKIHGATADIQQVLRLSRIGLSSLAVGLARGAMEQTNTYAAERRQFGRPLNAFQATQFKLADMATRVDAARLLTLRAALAADRNADELPRQSSAARLFATETARFVCDEAVQIHGGYGYTREYAVERHFRDSKVLTIDQGSSEEHRRIIARELGV